MMSRRVRVLALIDLVQDIDVLLPVLLAVRGMTGWKADVWVSHWLDAAAPRVGRILRLHGFPTKSVRRQVLIKGDGPSLTGHDVLLTASESTSAAHSAGHALVLRARGKGLHTATFQHGLENVGLSPGPSGAWELLGSETVYCWFDPKHAHPDMPSETRPRLVGIGRPTPTLGPTPPRFDLGVFENLHWDRYSDEFRSDFVGRLLMLADHRPDLTLYVRSHPAGGWLDNESPSLLRRPNITFASSDASRHCLMGGAETVSMCRRVVTTPSTVALDGVMAGRPVALVGDPGPAYAPLSMLAEAADWLEFADGRRDGSDDHVFLNRHLAAGDWRKALTDHLSQRLNS